MAPPVFLSVLDKILDLSHLLLMSVILFGWMIRRFRNVHLIITLLTGISWLVYMPLYWFGYCIITEWHWQILSEMGMTNLPETYAQYIIERVTGLLIQKENAQALVLYCWSGSLIMSLILFKKGRYLDRQLKVAK
jgi:hypothetical protein